MLSYEPGSDQACSFTLGISSAHSYELMKTSEVKYKEAFYLIKKQKLSKGFRTVSCKIRTLNVSSGWSAPGSYSIIDVGIKKHDMLLLLHLMYHQLHFS